VGENEERKGRSADEGLFIALELGISASWDAETQVLPAQPQSTRKSTIGTVIQIGRR
jgi:hypothetical protein